MSYEYKFDKHGCWYASVCDRYQSPECCASCIRYMEMHYLMETSGLPRKKQYAQALTPSQQDYDSFIALKEIKDDILNFVENGESLYIYSDYFGNGKTSWSIKLLQKYFDQIWPGNGFKRRGLFVSVPQLLTKNKEIISNPDPDFISFRDGLTEVDLVVWDDIAATNLSNYDYNNLLTYIDARKLKGLANIYTGNITSEAKMCECVGTRLSSRIWNASIRVQFVGADRRGVR